MEVVKRWYFFLPIRVWYAFPRHHWVGGGSANLGLLRPPQAPFSALRRRCWTADRRRQRGLPTHLLCPLYGLAPETLDHISLHCSYAQELWAHVVARLGLPNIVPVLNVGINDWWLLASTRVAKPQRKQLNSLVMLVLHVLWLERNDRVFQGNSLQVAATASKVLDEWGSWLSYRGVSLGEID
ncbi:hypothetical protein QYE76_034860 [Lolium multiflorum]|uniref:Reverse transcriptase zinc-binding domain-containing protein n=1 Tax=Lolium multiflorum TaxID=4521 RepID=A0AAD8QZE2_LOLMU|nr:hypothetical protein QYE76_034858 [Lolium multiflorum]KAK1611187.1 hypothetical protein QYE76_034860 [Lolium multiflorum]